MRQSRVEIEDILLRILIESACSKHWTSVKGGAQMCDADAWISHKHVQAPPLTKVQRHSTSNTVMQNTRKNNLWFLHRTATPQLHETNQTYNALAKQKYLHNMWTIISSNSSDDLWGYWSLIDAATNTQYTIVQVIFSTQASAIVRSLWNSQYHDSDSDTQRSRAYWEWGPGEGGRGHWRHCCSDHDRCQPPMPWSLRENNNNMRHIQVR